MTKKSISRLLQASLMCCLAVLFTACDDVFGSEDNPTPAYLSMSEAPVTLKAGDTYRRKAISVTTAVVEYTSSDTNVVTVDGEGMVTAIAEGEATITATATGYSTGGKKIYQADSKSYKLTVKPATLPAATVTEVYAAYEYNEGAWDGTKVVFTKQTAASVTAVTDATANVTWDAGWYTVSGNVTITGNVTLGAETHLILQDGATLTINGQLNCSLIGKNLYIYGQKKGDGKLNVTNNSGKAINSDMNYRIDIHGGEITAAGSNYGLYTGHLAVYGGKLTATSNSSDGINFQNTIDVYDGVVEATSNATSGARYGIRSGGFLGSQILTVYGGKVTATGNGIMDQDDYGSGFACYVKSGTSGIKFYFSDNGTTWGNGTGYDSATEVGTDDAAAATRKRYAKAE